MLRTVRRCAAVAGMTTAAMMVVAGPASAQVDGDPKPQVAALSTPLVLAGGLLLLSLAGAFMFVVRRRATSGV